MKPSWKARELAFVRQFSRAILADQITGDEVARAALSLTDLSQFDSLDEKSRRSAIFKTFLSNWRAATTKGPAHPFSDTALLASIPVPTNKPRQLLLLVDVLGIPLDMSADLIEVPAQEARALLKEERQQISRPVEGSVLVLEDEPIIAMDVTNLLETMGLTVVGQARAYKQAVDIAHRHHPNLLLADYDLGEGATGLDAVKAISAEMPIATIFLTGYPDEVLAGNDYEPAFILAKPYQDRALRAAVAHAVTTPRIRYID